MTKPSSTYAGCVQTCRTAFEAFDVHVLARTPSTQDRVRAAARRGAPAGFSVVAAEQTAGRGRQGRSWVAPADTALLMSILVDAGSCVSAMPLAAGLAVADAMAGLGAQTELKWPNDVVVDGRKLAGVLCEIEPRAPAASVVIGIGINLTVAAFPDDVAGVSLHTLIGEKVPWDVAMARVVPALQRRLAALDAGGVAAIADDWRARATGLGRAVTAITPSGVISGIAVDIDSDGALLLTTIDGSVRLLAGDVHIGAQSA